MGIRTLTCGLLLLSAVVEVQSATTTLSLMAEGQTGFIVGSQISLRCTATGDGAAPRLEWLIATGPEDGPPVETNPFTTILDDVTSSATFHADDLSRTDGKVIQVATFLFKNTYQGNHVWCLAYDNNQLAHYVSQQLSQSQALGSSCSTASASTDCSQISSAVCDTSSTTPVCVCSSGYTDSNGNLPGGQCDQQAGVGQQCSATIGCAATFSSCVNGVCRCSNGYTTNNNVCQLPVFGEACTLSVGCAAGTNINCIFDTSSYVCRCSSGFYYSSGMCLQATEQLGSPCTTGACSTQNSFCECQNSPTCSFSVCDCVPGYVDSNGDAAGGSCDIPVAGQPCRQTIGCAGSSNSNCLFDTDTSSYVCGCSSGFFNNGGTCQQASAQLGSSCTTGSCSIQNSFCSSSVCECVAGYVDSNDGAAGGSCDLPVAGQPCRQTIGCTGSSNSNCLFDTDTSSYVCRCSSGFFNNGGTCQQAAVLGGSCVSGVAGACADPNAACQGGICSCSPSYTQQSGQCVVDTGSTCSACPSGTQTASQVNGASGYPSVGVDRTCYAIFLNNATTMNCRDVKDGVIRDGRWEFLYPNGTWGNLIYTGSSFINGDWQNPPLTISNAQGSYSGSYRCTLCYQPNSGLCTSGPIVELKVCGTAITAVSVSVSNLNPVEGNSVTLTCTTTPAGVATNYRWLRDNQLLGNTAATYFIPSVSKADAGTYTCRAWNEFNANNPESGSTQPLNVQYTPQRTGTGSGVIVVNANLAISDTNLDCSALVGNPAVTIYRFYKGTQLLYEGPLSSFPVTSDNQGYGAYTCTATNSIGTSSALSFQVQAGQGPNAAAATEDSGGISTGAIAAIVLGIIFFLLLIIIIIICCCNYGWCRKKEKVEPEVVAAPPVKPYIPSVSTDFEEPAYEPRYYLAPAKTAGPIISMRVDNYDQPRAHQLPALDTHYLYTDDEPKKKKRRRRKKKHHQEAPPEPVVEETRYAEVVQPDDDDLVVIPGNRRSNYYE